MSLELPETRLSRVVDQTIATTGRLASWLWLILTAIIVVNVSLRHLAGEGFVQLEELQWHINSLGFLVAMAWCYRHDAHIRIDLISSQLSQRAQAWIELYGTLLLLLPFVVMVMVFAMPFVAHSYAVSEISQSPGGLPYRWLMKAVLPATFGLLLLAIFARLSRIWKLLASGTAEPQS